MRIPGILRFAVAATCVVLSTLGLSAPAWAQSSSYAVAAYPAKAAAPETLRLPVGAVPATLVRLEAVEAAQIDAIRHANSLTPLKRLQIGIGRAVEGNPAASDVALAWTPVAGGYVVVNSGYGLYYHMPGNVLLVFAAS